MKSGTAALFFIFILVLFILPSPVLSAGELEVSVIGTDVDLDWSSMPVADHYTLYYAFPDYRCAPDINTLGSIDMGNLRNLHAPGLPGGLMLYVAIVAHTPEGDVLSSIGEIVTFSGTVDLPETGDVLLEVKDAAVLGDMSVQGTISEDGSEIIISSISGNYGYGSYVLRIENDRPASLTIGGTVFRFSYHADGSVGIEAVQDSSAMEIKSAVGPVMMYKAAETITCSDYDDGVYDYLAENKWHMMQKAIQEYEAHPLYHLEQCISIAICAIGQKKYGDFPSHHRRELNMYCGLEQYNHADAFTARARKLAEYLQLVKWAQDTLMEEITEDIKQGLMYDFYEQCGFPSGIVELIVPGIGRANIDTTCPVPEGAEYREFCGRESGTDIPFFTEYYTLEGIGSVGPKWWYDSCDRQNRHFTLKECRDEQGHYNGWDVEYEKGVPAKITRWQHGVKDGHSYDLLPDGKTVSIDWIWKDGRNTGYVKYLENGKKQTCDYAATPPCVWGTWR